MAPPASPAKSKAPYPDIEPLGKYVGLVLLGVAIILPFIPGVDRRIVDLAILMLTYVMLGWGLNIVVGLAGLLDLGYVAFYAVGASTPDALCSHAFYVSTGVSTG